MTSHRSILEPARGSTLRRHARRAALTALATTSVFAAAPAATSLAAPMKMADMFLVEQHGGWFCGGAQQLNGANCPNKHNSVDAARMLLGALPNGSDDLYLRVAKARNNCADGQLPRLGMLRPVCDTGVPAPAECPDDSTPFCTLKSLRKRGVNLGVVIGAEVKQAARSAADLAWHSCQIANTDDENLYSFVWLDEVAHLDPTELTKAVTSIQAGRFVDGTFCDPSLTAQQPLKVVTNDRTWQPGAHTLGTGAWAHAKRIELLQKSDARIGRGATRDVSRALVRNDLAFVRAVNAIGGSNAVLRLELPAQTSLLSTFSADTQCSLLKRWTQLGRRHGYTLIDPIYVHGAARPPRAHHPYDSIAEGTFGLQMALITGSGSSACPAKTKGRPDKGPGAKSGGRKDRAPSDDDMSNDDVPEDTTSEDTEPAEVPIAEAPLPPGPAPRPPGVGMDPITAEGCNSARLNGWVNAHGTTTRFHFEFWPRSGGATQRTGEGTVDAGNVREGVSRVADMLRKGTEYNAKLIASSAAGRSVSDAFAFKTKAHC